MTTFNIFPTTRVRIGVRDAPHIWGAGEIRDAGERRLFGGLARSEPLVTPHAWGTGEMSTEISATYLGRWGNKHWKSRRICVALGHDELNTLRPGPGYRFPDDIFKYIFLNENIWISIEISLRFVLKGSINNVQALVQIMAWRRPGDKSLSEPMMISLPPHICATRPQWVN